MSIIRALDVGFGSTKFVVDHPANGSIQCKLFPSLAPHAPSHDFMDGAHLRPNVAVVVSDGHHYVVGPESELWLRTHHSRVLNSNYVHSAEYLALARGAFHYMNVPTIDLLVVGLPVAHFHSKKVEIETRLVGVHPLPGDRRLTVRRVLTVPQPVGGLLYCTCDTEIFESMHNQTNLVIDPGYFTVDWVVTLGLKPTVQRCGSFNGGVSAVLARMAEGISKRHNIVFNDLNAIDEGLRNGSTICLYGQDEPLEPYLSRATAATDAALSSLINCVGDGQDIRNVFLVGGGASLFYEAVVRRFPRQRVYVVPDAQLANVRGFQLIGESQWTKLKDCTA